MESDKVLCMLKRVALLGSHNLNYTGSVGGRRSQSFLEEVDAHMREILCYAFELTSPVGLGVMAVDKVITMHAVLSKFFDEFSCAALPFDNSMVAILAALFHLSSASRGIRILLEGVLQKFILADVERLFLFVDVYMKCKHYYEGHATPNRIPAVPSVVQMFVRRFYQSVNDKEAVLKLLKVASGCGWTHKQLMIATHTGLKGGRANLELSAFKLFHEYVFHGVEGPVHCVSRQSVVSVGALDVLETIVDLDKLKFDYEDFYDHNFVEHSTSIPEILALLEKYPTIGQRAVLTELHCEPAVCLVFLERMPAGEMLAHLPNLVARGLLAVGSKHLEVVERRLKDDSQISATQILYAWKSLAVENSRASRKREQRIARIERAKEATIAEKENHQERVSIAMTQFADATKGVCSVLAGAYDFVLSKNSPAAQKRFCVIVDVRPVCFEPLGSFAKRNHHHGANNAKRSHVTSAMAAADVVLTALRVEERAMVAAFTRAEPEKIKALPVARQQSIDEVVETMRKMDYGEPDVKAAVDYALSDKVQPDVTVLILHRCENAEEANLICGLWNSLARTNRSKLVLCFLEHTADCAKSNVDDVLVINGVDEFVPKIIWHFAKGNLSVQA